jgi:hypothetical protein
MSIYYSMLRPVYTSRSVYALVVYILTAQTNTLCLDTMSSVVSKANTTLILLSHTCSLVEAHMEVFVATV